MDFTYDILGKAALVDDIKVVMVSTVVTPENKQSQQFNSPSNVANTKMKQVPKKMSMDLTYEIFGKAALVDDIKVVMVNTVVTPETEIVQVHDKNRIFRIFVSKRILKKTKPKLNEVRKEKLFGK